MDSGLQIGFLLSYFVAVYALGLWSRKGETTGEFLIANRSVGTLLTTASVSAVIGGVFLGNVSFLAFEFGMGAMWLVGGFAFGLFLLGAVASRIKAVADEHRFLTLPDYLFTKFDARTGYLGAGVLFLGFLLILAGQFVIAGLLFSTLFPIEYPLAVFGMGGATLAYVVLGGFKAVVRTDLLQFAIMAVVFGLFLPFNVDVRVLGTLAELGSPGALTIASLFLGGTASLFMGADVWQRLYSARTPAVARNSLFLASAIWVVFGLSLTLLGIAARGSAASADQALLAGLFEAFPEQLAGLAAVALLAALMSTIDTEMFLLASSVAKDFVAKRKALTDREMARIIRGAMIGISVPAMAIAIGFPRVYDLLAYFNSLMLALFPAVLSSLFWTLKKQAVFASVVVGLFSLVPLFLLGQFNPDTAPLAVLAGSTVALIAGQRIAAG